MPARNGPVPGREGTKPSLRRESAHLTLKAPASGPAGRRRQDAADGEEEAAGDAEDDGPDGDSDGEREAEADGEDDGDPDDDPDGSLTSW